MKIEIFPSGKIVIDQPAKPSYTFRWTFKRNVFVEGYMARITTEEQVTVSVQPLTAKGHPAAIDGDVELTLSDTSVATVTRIDSKSFLIKGNMAAAIGATPVPVQVIASFDADLGAGVTPVEFTGVLEVASPQATTGQITFGTPSLQP